MQTAKQLAEDLSVSVHHVYAHVDEYGGVRLGRGPRARLRFPPTEEAIENMRRARADARTPEAHCLRVRPGPKRRGSARTALGKPLLALP